LSPNGRAELFKYIWGTIEKYRSHPYWINGVEDHLHIATHIHPSITLADLVKGIKLSSNSHIGDHCLFHDFSGWQGGYAAFTYSYRDKDTLIAYIKNQEEHHRTVTFKEELIALLNAHGIEFDERYLL